jgi:succinate dehydrogenase / fumarate reductase flavoprotein subunit
MYLEMREGRGIGGQRYLLLDARPQTVNYFAELDGRTRPDGSPYRVTAQEILSKIPDITDFCRTYLGLDPVLDPIPVQPTAHYAMGGIPTDMLGRVVVDDRNTVLPGLYAAGEVACVSVHGANRLGTNSLVDLIVFGKHAGIDAAKYANDVDFSAVPSDAADFSRQQLDALLSRPGGERPAQLNREMRSLMFDNVGVFRTQEGLRSALTGLTELRRRFQGVSVQDHGKIFNLELMGAWELGNMLDLALVTTASALARTESRGAHAREDCPRRDDQNWLKHTLAWLGEDSQVQLDYKPVTITSYQPKERVY